MGSVFIKMIPKVANVLQCAVFPQPNVLFICPSAAIFIREFREQSKIIILVWQTAHVSSFVIMATYFRHSH